MSKPIRLIYKNLARLTGVAANSSTAGYPASNMLTSDKAETWRTASLNVTISGVSATPIRATCVYLLGNFSPAAQFRVLLSPVTPTVDPVLITGFVTAVKGAPVEIDGWTPAQAASAYAHGGGARALVWFTETEFKAWAVQIVDPANPQGYIEVAFLVLGKAWSPTYDLEGAELTQHDTATSHRSAAGSLKKRKGIRYNTLDFDLSDLTKADFKEALRIFRYCGTTTPILAVPHPEDPDPVLEGATAIYGCLDEVAGLALQGPDSFATSVRIEEL